MWFHVNIVYFIAWFNVCGVTWFTYGLLCRFIHFYKKYYFVEETLPAFYIELVNEQSLKTFV